jgi:hypothetical protein
VLSEQRTFRNDLELVVHTFLEHYLVVVVAAAIQVVAVEYKQFLHST